jgi:nucleoside-diphosphate-sugar epimerase
MNKILVTGGAGFIGSNLIKRLLKDGYDAISLDDYSIGAHDNEQKGAKYIEGSILDIDKLKIPDVDFVVHLAAKSRIQPSFKHPLETFKTNAEGTMAVLEWARNKGNVRKLIYSGSSSRWHNPEISPYATAKDAGERLCKMYRTALGLNTDIVRFYNVYGPGEILDGEWAAIIGKWRRLIAQNEPIEIVGDGTQRRAFTFVDDIIDGIMRVMESDENSEDAWELGGPFSYSINEIADMFQTRFPDLRRKFVPKRPGEYLETHRENDNALERLGWEAHDQLRQYIMSL